jgi:integrase
MNHIDFLSYLKKYAPGVGDMGQVKSNHAEDYVSMLQKTGRFSDERDMILAVATTNKFIKDFRSIFNRLRNDAGLIINPFDEEYTPVQTADVVARDAFEIEELQLVGEMANMFVYHIFMLGMNTGFREGDICTLRWSEVDLKSNLINRVMLKTGKEVHPPILSHLRTYLERIYLYTGHQEYVSPVHSEIYLEHPTTISARVRVELQKLGVQTQVKVPNRTRMQSIKNVHSLRHAFCYYAMVEGVELPIVQSIVGHVDRQMTLMYANHASQKIIQERVKRIPDYLNPNDVRMIEGVDYTEDHCYDNLC